MLWDGRKTRQRRDPFTLLSVFFFVFFALSINNMNRKISSVTYNMDRDNLETIYLRCGRSRQSFLMKEDTICKFRNKY